MASRIDSRDLVEELDTLEAEDELDESDAERLEAIRALFEEIEGYAGDSARDGIFLIPESDFEDYAREYAEDIGYLSMIERDTRYGSVPWPFSHIDWEAAAEELQQDYTSVTFEGAEYLYR